jgi:UDP-glucose 4-epimerase
VSVARHILVTGGAGYIGSHACKALRAAGYVPVTLDNLSTGWRDAVKFGPLVVADLLDRDALAHVFAAYQPDAVVHFAALSQVGESVAEPGLYWRNNVQGSLNLIEAAASARCLDFVFSSTCATYGEHDGILLDEATPQRPTTPYGASKRAVEDILTGFGAARGMRSVVFRYFNVAGADPDREIGESHDPETHLIPLTIDAALGRRCALTVFGADYPTPDGTCVRDYVHVCDLVGAHLLGLEWLRDGKPSTAFNLGSGRHGPPRPRPGGPTPRGRLRVPRLGLRARGHQAGLDPEIPGPPEDDCARRGVGPLTLQKYEYKKCRLARSSRRTCWSYTP